MISLPSDARIFLYGAHIDLRNGFEGLSLAASSIFKENIANDTYFVFLNRRRTRMKVLWWGSNDLAIWYTRSRKGVFCPRSPINTSISQREFYMILQGFTPEHLLDSQDLL